MKIETMCETMTDIERKIARENSWLTRLTLILADKPQTVNWNYSDGQIFITSTVNEKLNFYVINVVSKDGDKS